MLVEMDDSERQGRTVMALATSRIRSEPQSPAYPTTVEYRRNMITPKMVNTLVVYPPKGTKHLRMIARKC